MWICPRCQTSNKDSTNFCKRCGEYVADEAKQQDNSAQPAPQVPSAPAPAPPTPPQRAQSGPVPAQQVRQTQPRPQARTAQPPSQPVRNIVPISPQTIRSSASILPQSAVADGVQPIAPAPTVSPAPTAATAPKRPIINKKLLRAAEEQAALQGETSDTEEIIDWSSASTIADSMRTQLAEKRQSGSAMPTDLRDELFGGTGRKAGSGDLPPVALRESFLSQAESAISKRVLLIITAVSLIALIATVIGSSSIINSFNEGVTPPSLPTMSPLRVGTIAGVWLGVDRSQGSPGVPVTYLFTRPNWLIVTEPGGFIGRYRRKRLAVGGRGGELQD